MLSLAEIELKTKKISDDLGFDPMNMDIRDLVLSIGGKITYSDEQHYSFVNGGSLVVRSQNYFEITLSRFTPILRDNFTLAHELGHYFLHSGNPPGSRRIEKKRYGSGPEEIEANRFAACLLMPESKFKKYYEIHSGDLDTLSDIFKVSYAAALIRKKSIGLN